MTQLEQIKAEIERRMLEDYNSGDNEIDEVAQGVCAGILSFIESLEKEQDVDLDDEIDNFLYPKGFIRKYDGVHTPGVCWRDWKGKKYVNRNVTPDDMRKYAHYFYDLGLNAKDSAPKIKGWVARDKDGELSFFSEHPIRFEDCGTKWCVPGACIVCHLGFNESFSDLKWEDEPIEVELTINRV